MNIDGKTALYLVVGDPIAQVKSPGLYTDWCVAHGVNAVFVPFQIDATEGAQVFDALRHVPNLGGLIVTIPFKPLAADQCQVLSPRARAAGAANVIRPIGDGQWAGDALDGVGCVAALRARDTEIRGTTVQLVGAGGAGASVAAALAEAGAARLAVDDLDAGRAADLASRLRREFPGVEASTGRLDPQEVTIFVNASPAGMAEGDPLPISPDAFGPGKLLVEMIMQPARTRLLEAAEAAGGAVVPGREVLDGQVAETLRFFNLS
ncbi:shikimate dehydrogenase family protein [Paracoccus sulfuroxidans]|uniref:Shikimate dehydrogenase n=1 Tax=Paracoccus sulfuroxidans TaxID=384678 RepID=A0A562NH56_9RHOB|nr:hypothetical protein [Paracoccus sulfuroxidans]TWI31434.1 shikimate dehydrogenase [Paracoccus sulfuroxidans]